MGEGLLMLVQPVDWLFPGLKARINRPQYMKRHDIHRD